MTVPSSLRDSALSPLWAAVSDRLERRGTANRGSMRVPPLTSRGVHLLTSLLRCRPGAFVDLDALEVALRSVGAGSALPDALDVLGHPVSLERARRRAERLEARGAREDARTAAARWPESWAEVWIDEVIRAGVLRDFDSPAATALVAAVRAVLDATNDSQVGAPRSRTELAALVLGSSHALDSGSRLEAAATRALQHVHGASDTRTVWERAGAPLDLVSGPALTWALPIVPADSLARFVGGATALGLPVHLSQVMLRRCPARVPAGTVVLVAENPRVVEAAAERRVSKPVVTTNGNPSGATRLLFHQLRACDAVLRYHGDFDAAGLGMTARMSAVGATPWLMDLDDYLRAVEHAAADDVELPLDHHTAPPTPWCPPLAAAFDRVRRVVHEERVIDDLLGPCDVSP